MVLKMESWKVGEILGRIDRTWQPIKFEGRGNGRIKDVYKTWVYSTKRYHNRNMITGRKAVSGIRWLVLDTRRKLIIKTKRI